MSENHRYYWLKLQETFFEDDTIDFIESQENGEKYVLFYLKLCLKALKNEGKLIRYVGELLMPYDEIGIAKLTKTDVDTVRSALLLFSNIGLIKRLESGEIYLTQLNELIGTETSAAQRKRKQRINEKARLSLECDNVTDMSQIGHTDIDIEKELEKESEKDCNNEIPKLEDFVVSENKSANAENEKKSNHRFKYYEYTLHHSRIYTELRTAKLIEDKPVEYNYGLISKRINVLLSNPFFTKDKILQGITNAKNDPSCIKNNFTLEQMLTEANMTRLINKCYISTFKSGYTQKKQEETIARVNQDTNKNYAIF